MGKQPILQPTALNERFLKPSQVADKWGVNMVVYGASGVGKTTFAASAQDSPYGKDVIIIDVEGGVRSISDRDDITVFRPDTLQDIKELFGALKAGTLPFQTVVLDSLGETQALGLRDIMRTSKTPDLPGLQDYGKSNTEITMLVRAFRGLAQSNGINVIFTCLDQDQKDETSGAVRTKPALTPKALETVIGAVDMCGYLTQEKDGTRTLKFAPHPSYIAKLRQPMTGVQIPLTISNPTMPAILDIVRKGHGGEDTA